MPDEEGETCAQVVEAKLLMTLLSVLLLHEVRSVVKRLAHGVCRSWPS